MKGSDDDMGIAKGTKLTENPKNKTLKIRIDKDISEKLEFLVKKRNTSKAEIIRNGIEIQYENEK